MEAGRQRGVPALSGMSHDLTAASRHEHLVLYDPGAIPPEAEVDPDLDAQDPKLPPAAAFRELAERGRALIVHIPTEDCEARLRVFVDEDPPEALRTHGRLVLERATLAVPTGRLKADGLEFLTRPGEVRRHSQVAETEIPPGEYSLEVLDLLSWKLRHGAAETQAGTSSWERLVHRLTLVYTWLGIILMPANLLGAPMIVGGLWKARGWRTGLTAAGVILAVDAVVLGGFWLLQAAQKKFPALTRVRDAEATFDRQYPDVVIVLRRLAAPADGAAPAFVQIRV
jgi:hypothetical protein